MKNFEKQMLPKKLEVLDKGFVTLIDYMGSDLRTVNAARISFGKQKEVFDEKDEGLVKYLAEHEHQSPFRHNKVTFHVKAPIFVLRQWMKHRIDSEFNELSGRYVEFPPDDFYIPDIFRQQSVDNKQGSAGEVESNTAAQLMYTVSCENSIRDYQRLISMGVCREQARCILPLGMYSEVFWTASLQTIAHFVKLRNESHAQWEIQQYAIVVEQLTKELFPVSYKHLIANI